MSRDHNHPIIDTNCSISHSIRVYNAEAYRIIRLATKYFYPGKNCINVHIINIIIRTYHNNCYMAVWWCNIIINPNSVAG